jgi:hypothetical protein
MLLLSGHAQAFSGSNELTKALEDQLPATGGEMQRRLRALDEGDLQKTVGDLLNKREINALLKRRDRIVQLADSSAGR